MARIISLEDIGSRSSGAVFMDNLTISHALRPLVGYQVRDVTEKDGLYSKYIGTEILLYKDHPRASVKGDEWNYPLNDAFRFAIDLFSLGQVIESIILFSNIFVDALWIDRWGVIVREHNKTIFPRVADPLDSIIVPIELPPEKRITYLANAVWKANMYAHSDAFKEFMRLLSVTSTESAFVHMTHAYYETGYSDEGVFPRNEAWPSDQPSTHLKMTIEKAKESALINDLLSIENGISQYWNDTIEADVLERTDFETGDSHDKFFSSRHVMQNAVAAFFYHTMSNECNTMYFPHLLRSSFVGFDQVVSGRSLSSTAQKMIKSIEKAREGRVQPINEFYKNRVIDITIPSLFTSVLKNVEDPSQILPTAIQIRNTKEAQTFRKWATETDRRLSEGTANIKTLSKEIEEIQDFLKDWIKNPSEQVSTVEIGLALGPLQINRSFPWPKLSIKRKPHIVFLQRMAQINDETDRFAKLVAEVFGESIGAVYQRYLNSISEFQNMPVDFTGVSHSPLKWRLEKANKEMLSEMKRKINEALEQLNRGEITQDEYLKKLLGI